jgi:hypothetical protein
MTDDDHDCGDHLDDANFEAEFPLNNGKKISIQCCVQYCAECGHVFYAD